jgi:hypothetical protein
MFASPAPARRRFSSQVPCTATFRVFIGSNNDFEASPPVVSHDRDGSPAVVRAKRRDRQWQAIPAAKVDQMVKQVVAQGKAHRFAATAR